MTTVIWGAALAFLVLALIALNLGLVALFFLTAQAVTSSWPLYCCQRCGNPHLGLWGRCCEALGLWRFHACGVDRWELFEGVVVKDLRERRVYAK